MLVCTFTRPHAAASPAKGKNNGENRTISKKQYRTARNYATYSSYWSKVAAINPKSIKILRTNTGIVILVGIAARLVTKTIPMAAIATINITRLPPNASTIMLVMGVNTQPCPANASPIHNIRLNSCS
ncbi:MAG TPA: hypothetical protein VFZ47_04720, partial [Chitinophagaceae bacterium]